jgi:hypothetical protein
MKISALFLIAAFLAAADPIYSFAQCSLPGSPAPATIDSTFDAYVTQNGPGWTGGDGTYSLQLPDGTDLWMWSDSYIGTVDANTRLRKNYLFTAHNSLTILDQSSGSWATVGYPPQTTSYFVPSNKNDWYWQGSGLITQTSSGSYEIHIMLLEWTGIYQLVGHSVATLSWPDFSIKSITPVKGLDTSLEWGTKILHAGNYYFIYGMKDPGTNAKTPYVARTTTVWNLTDATKWQFWNATQGQWLAGESNATQMRGLAAITPEYSVDQMNYNAGAFYLMTGMDPLHPQFPLWNAVTTWYSCSPQGPWSHKTTGYLTPEAGANGCKVGTVVAYNAKTHAEFTNPDGILISYNVNANNSKDLVCADDYKPRFVRMQIPGVTDQLH